MTKYGKVILGAYALLTVVFLIAGFYRWPYFLVAAAIGGGGGYYLYRRYAPKAVKYP